MSSQSSSTPRRAGAKQRASGQSLVEFALLLPVMLLLLIGALDIGRLFYFDIVVGNAVREGARQAVDPAYTNAQITQVVQSSAPGVAVGGVTVSPSSRSSANSGEEVSVTATYTLVVFTPGISSLIGSPKAVSHTAKMKIF
jgi:Flp pilus assembly protein TadG